MRELIDKLRDFEFDGPAPIGPLYGVGYYKALEAAADMIEEALPKWTKITEDEATWPEKDTDTFMRIWSYDNNCWGRPWVQTNPDSFYDVSYEINEAWYRPLCDIDTPPKED